VPTTDIDEDSLTDRALNDKLFRIKEKLNKRRATLMESAEKAPLMSRSSMQKANKFIDINTEEEFRCFNIYIPKTVLCQSTATRTTFSQMKQNFVERKKESSINMAAQDIGMKNSDFKFKKFKRLNNFKPNFGFFERKFIEYQYNDVSDKT
jgi:hypothetical protein